MELTEIGLISASISVLVFYHLFFYFRVRTKPASTVIGVTRRARKMWVEVILAKKDGILAVQTFRNW